MKASIKKPSEIIILLFYQRRVESSYLQSDNEIMVNQCFDVGNESKNRFNKRTKDIAFAQSQEFHHKIN